MFLMMMMIIINIIYIIRIIIISSSNSSSIPKDMNYIREDFTMVKSINIHTNSLEDRIVIYQNYLLSELPSKY